MLGEGPLERRQECCTVHQRASLRAGRLLRCQLVLPPGAWLASASYVLHRPSRFNPIRHGQPWPGARPTCTTSCQRVLSRATLSPVTLGLPAARARARCLRGRVRHFALAPSGCTIGFVAVDKEGCAVYKGCAGALTRDEQRHPRQRHAQLGRHAHHPLAERLRQRRRECTRAACQGRGKLRLRGHSPSQAGAGGVPGESARRARAAS